MENERDKEIALIQQDIQYIKNDSAEIKASTFTPTVMMF